MYQLAMKVLRTVRGQSLRFRRRLLPGLVVGTRKDAITVTWLALATVLPFVHLRFGAEIIDPFLFTSMPMRTDSFVWMLCDEVTWICFSVFAYRACMVRLKTFALLWLVYCVYDLIMFLWCYNQKNYYYVPYLILLLITIKLFKR